MNALKISIHCLWLLTVVGATLGSAVAQTTWKRTFGGLSGESARSIKALDDGGAVVCGSTGSFGVSGGDMYVLRLDIDGQLLWSRVLGGPGVESGSDILVLPDGGFLAIGTTNSSGAGGYDGFIVRLSESGQELWQHTYGTTEWDLFHAGTLHQGGFLLTGQTFGMGAVSGDLWLVHVDGEGAEEWSRTFGTADTDEARAVLDLGAEGCMLGGTFGIGESTADAGLVRVSAAGDEVWSLAVGGDPIEVGYDIAQLADGDFVVTGYMEGAEGVRQMFLGKATASGDEVWHRSVSSAGDDWEARSVIELSNAELVVAGYTKEYGAGEKDMSMMFLTADGDFLSGPTYGGFGSDEAWSLDRTNDGGFYVAGSSDSYGSGANAVFVVRSDGDTLNGAVVNTYDDVSIASISEHDRFVVYPVPAASGSVIHVDIQQPSTGKFILHDGSGRLIRELLASGASVQLPELDPGVYQLRLLTSSVGLRTTRLIIY